MPALVFPDQVQPLARSAVRLAAVFPHYPPHSGPEAAADPALAARTKSVLDLVERQALPVWYLGSLPLPTGYRLLHGRVSAWVLVALDEDPFFRDRDGFPLPRRILAHLQELHRSGLEFDTLYIAHELKRGTLRDGEPLTAKAIQPPPPQSVRSLSQRLGRIADLLWKIAIPGLAIGSGVVAGAAAVSGLAALDPIVLGVVVGKGRPLAAGEHAAWFYLCHWRWGEEE